MQALRCYVIYDRLAEECGPVLCLKNDGVARRAYRHYMQSVQAGKEDEYWLFCVGDLDPQSMVLSGFKPVRVEINKAELNNDADN